MATKKITDLTELTSAASGDVLPIVDVDLDITKKISVSNLTSGIQAQVDAKISKSDGTTYDINALAAVTQAEYDALTPSATTLYFII